MFASDRKARKARQKVELRAKQLNNANEVATPGSGGSTSALEGGPSQVGYGFMNGDEAVTSPLHPPYRASPKTAIGHDQNMGLSSGGPCISDLVDVQYQATGDDEIQENIERLRLSNTPPRDGDSTMRGVSPQHRWGRVFAERGTPLSRIGVEASQLLSSSPGTPPLQRRAAVRRRRMHTSDTAIAIPTDLEGLTANKRPPPPLNTDSEVINNSFNVSPITTRGSICWDSPNTVTPTPSIPHESKTLPLHYRLPLTPTKTSPLGVAPGPSTAGLPRAQGFPLPQLSSSLSVPNSPAFHALNLAYQPGTPNLTYPDPSRCTQTDTANYSHNSMGAYTNRPRSASPMVHDHDPRLRAIKQSAVLQRSINIAPPHGGHDATRHTSPGLGYSRFIPGSPNAAMVGGDSQSHPSKSPKGGRVVKFRCVVCMEKYRVNKMIQAPNCMHFLCSTCVKGICLGAPPQKLITNVLVGRLI